MPEAYAVRMGSNGIKSYYRTKKDYQMGKLSSFGRAGKHARMHF